MVGGTRATVPKRTRTLAALIPTSAPSGILPCYPCSRSHPTHALARVPAVRGEGVDAYCTLGAMRWSDASPARRARLGARQTERFVHSWSGDLGPVENNFEGSAAKPRQRLAAGGWRIHARCNAEVRNDASSPLVLELCGGCLEGWCGPGWWCASPSASGRESHPRMSHATRTGHPPR